MDGSMAKIAVLAGGAGRRFGGVKPMQMLGGAPLICHPIAAALATGLETIVVAKSSSPLPKLDVPLIHEPDELHHPLCGIVTALERSDGSPVVTVACDMPFLSSELLLFVAGQERSAVCRLGGRLHPLLAQYRPCDLPALRLALKHQQSLADAVGSIDPLILDEQDLCRFGDPRTLCANINNPEQLRAAQRQLLQMPQHPSREALVPVSP